MNRRHKYKKKQSKIKEIIISNLEKNIKEYAIISIIFLIGIVAGVIFINNTTEMQVSEINNYLYTFIENLKNDSNINEILLLKDSIKKNCVLAIFLWFMGSTIIGISIVYITVCFRGFCLGYTISSIIASYGIRKRKLVFVFHIIFTKYYIYSVHNSSCRKWNEITQFHYER